MTGIRYTPELFVTTVVETPVALFLTTTVAPGMKPPSLSTTVPVNDVVELVLCASADDAARPIRHTKTRSLAGLPLIDMLLRDGPTPGGAPGAPLSSIQNRT